MHISKLRLRNFRNFRSATFKFEKGVNTLIGENGSGKTNALYALRLLLDDSLSRNAATLRQSDFCRSTQSWQGHWIFIAVDFEELDPSEGCQILKHNSGHMNSTDSGTYLYSFRPKYELRKALFDLQSETSKDALKDRIGSITIDDYEPFFSGRAQIDFCDDDEYRAVVGDFDKLQFPNPDDDDHSILGVKTNVPIHAEFTCTFVQALRDAVSDLRGYRNNPLLTLLRGLETDIDKDSAARISETVASLNSEISGLSQVQGIAIGIQETLFETVGHSFSPTVGIESSLPDDLEKLFQRLAITVGDETELPYKGDLSELSLGGANLIYLALKLLEYELKLSSDRVAHFLLIEEPEAHIHSHVQKTLFENQALKRTQVVVSTHSTHISSASAIARVNLLARGPSEAQVFHPAAGLATDKIARIERYLDAVRSTLLFAKGVLLVEGEAELILIPALVKAVFGVSVDELGISLISMHSAFFEHVAILFSEERIRRRCAIVTDLDRSVIPLSDMEIDDTKAQTRARASQISGQLRREKLESFNEDNSWVEAFYAKHTFEVDFLAKNNSRELVDTLPSIYTKSKNIDEATKKLESTEVATAGVEALRLANKVGKGWFSLLLTEHIYADTEIPNYIVDAIAFAAKDNVGKNALGKIASYRLDNEYFDESLRKKIVAAGKVSPQPTLIECFVSCAPQDPLSVLVTEMGVDPVGG